MTDIRAFLLAITLVAPLSLPVSAQETACEQPEPVCAARDAVFAISGFDPVGSAVRIGATRLVTARHTVADQEQVIVFLADGSQVRATPLPSDYPGDLLLLESEGLPDGPILIPGETTEGALLHTVGADLGRGAVRAYDAGPLRFLPAEGFPLARLHHAAYSQPGNSGGALVDEAGRLIGIAASGGEGRFEAIPSREIETLAARSGAEHLEASNELGAAVRICTLLLDQLQLHSEPTIDDEDAKAVETSCRRSGNRQLLDLAGQALGRFGRREPAVVLFEAALAEDPNAANSRIGLVVTLNLAKRYEDSLPHLEWLMEHESEDLQVLRLAIQSGVWGDDRALAERAFERLKVLNPQVAPAAKRFIDNPPPRP